MDNGSDLSADERHGLAMEYLQEGIECPFLENEICSIHSARPLACREYAVTSPAENCSEPTEETIEPLPVSVPVSATAHKLSAGIIGDGKPGYIPLVSALKWSKDNPDHYPRKTGPEWMQLIIENLNRPERTA
ncbi:MAG: YkgJ family cysteine cluster protein [Pyrinomonadaceae bacterium]